MRLLEKAVLYFTKIQFGDRNRHMGTEGKVIEQAGKPLQVKDKYITNIFKGYFFRAAKITANRGGNRTGGRELKNKFCMNINAL